MKALSRIACGALVFIGQIYILAIFAGCCLYATWRAVFDDKKET